MAQLHWNESMAQHFDAVVSEGPAGRRLVVAGEIDLATAPNLETSLRWFSGTSDREVVVDASRITFLDSSGLAVLVAVALDMALAGKQLVVRDPSPSVCRVLDITGLSSCLCVDLSGPD